MQTSVFSNTQNQYSACQQQDLSSQICNALVSASNMDNKVRTQAEQFMSSVAGQTGLIPSLLEIITSQEVS